MDDGNVTEVEDDYLSDEERAPAAATSLASVLALQKRPEEVLELCDILLKGTKEKENLSMHSLTLCFFSIAFSTL